MNEHPLVSVMMPTYNQEAYVEEAVRSVLDQDYRNIQLVIADDGSSDRTVEILRALADADDRIVLIADAGHLGVTGNCKRTLEHCTGEYVAFTAGDDIFLPGKLTAQLRWFREDPSRVLCGHDVEVFDTATRQRVRLFSEMRPLHSGEGAAAIIEKFVPFGGCAIMVRRAALPATLFDERLPHASDWKLWIDTLANGGTYGYVDGIYSRWQRHATNITRTRFQEVYADIFVTIALVEAAYPWLIRPAQRARARHYFEKGKRHLALEEPQTARRYFKAALWPFGVVSAKAAVGFLFSILPRAATPKRWLRVE
jgi:glycosyltransferase involved in cell wall biosynthesis